MRWLLLTAAALVLLAGLQLFVFTERTDTYFAWTIINPLAAAFLGAAYWASSTSLAPSRWRRGSSPGRGSRSMCWFPCSC
jgi:hypothetical protein